MHRTIVQDAGVDGSALCLSCWHFRRQAFLENEFHVFCVCPEYAKPRQELLGSLGHAASLNTHDDMLALLSGSQPSVLAALGRFCVRSRQSRRKLKILLESYSQQVEVNSFACRRAAWKFKRRPTCRHGVLFSRIPPTGCKCMSSSFDESDWTEARFMPAQQQAADHCGRAV